MPKKTTKKAKKDNDECGSCCKSSCKSMTCNTGGCGYFIGFIGAAVYYIQTATGFWDGVLGVLKALVWPAMLVYKLLGM